MEGSINGQRRVRPLGGMTGFDGQLAIICPSLALEPTATCSLGDILSKQ